MLTLSAVFDTKDYPTGLTKANGGDDGTTHDGQKLLVGLDYDIWGGTASAAYQKDNDQGVGGDNYELYFDYPINDGVSVKAGIFFEGNQTKQASKAPSFDLGSPRQGCVEPATLGIGAR